MRKNSTTYSLEELKTAIKENATMAATIRKLNLSVTTTNYRTIGKYIKNNNIDISHWLGHSFSKGKSYVTKNSLTLKEILVENSNFSRGRMKKILLKEGLLKNICYICEINEWMGKKLVLHIDHINGINNDNRLENLRLLCPNCHSQTETYAGRNIKKKNKEIYKCAVCEEEKQTKYSTYCRKCIPKRMKINWPSKEELEKLVWQMTIVKIAVQLGVSDRAVHKKCRDLNIEKPNQGYWLLKKNKTN